MFIFSKAMFQLGHIVVLRVKIPVRKELTFHEKIFKILNINFNFTLNINE